MPHLDANALTEDLKGLEFLAEVLETTDDREVPCFRPSDILPVPSEPLLGRVAPRRRRKRLSMVPEAA